MKFIATDIEDFGHEVIVFLTVDGEQYSATLPSDGSVDDLLALRPEAKGVRAVAVENLSEADRPELLRTIEAALA